MFSDVSQYQFNSLFLKPYYGFAVAKAEKLVVFCCLCFMLKSTPAFGLKGGKVQSEITHEKKYE